jgi:teichuronic acid biosynthesis glycosyltransferase TuaG
MDSVSSAKVTVLTTVFNGEKYLQETIDSVLNQSLGEFKYIIIDDGSTDRTKEILAKIQDNRVEIVKLPHGGRGVALNSGIEKCNTEFVAILDADDVTNKNRLACQLRVFEDNNDIDVVAGYFTLKISDLNSAKELQGDCKYSIIDYKQFIKHNAICHSSAMIKVKSLLTIGAYNAYRTELFDYDLWLRIMENGGVFVKIKKLLVFKRIHDEQSFEKRKRIKYLLSATKCKYRAILIASNNPIDYIYPILTFFYGLLPRKIREFRMEAFGRS